MSKASAVRPSFQTLLPTRELAEAFASKSAAYEAARYVRELRLAANLTQKELAERLDVSQARVSMIERGDGTDGPTFGLLKRIVLACGFVWSPNFATSGAAEHSVSTVTEAKAADTEAESASSIPQTRHVFHSQGD